MAVEFSLEQGDEIQNWWYEQKGGEIIDRTKTIRRKQCNTVEAAYPGVFQGFKGCFFETLATVPETIAFTDLKEERGKKKEEGKMWNGIVVSVEN